MTQRNYDDLPTVDDWADVPAFTNEDEEAEFWGTHGLGGRALESLGTFVDDELPPPRARSLRRQPDYRIAAFAGRFSRLVSGQQGAVPRIRRSSIHREGGFRGARLIGARS